MNDQLGEVASCFRCRLGLFFSTEFRATLEIAYETKDQCKYGLVYEHWGHRWKLGSSLV